MTFTLRPYQERALDELWSWFMRHPDGNPIVGACVGAGKSVMIAALAQRADREFPGTRVLVLVHQKELLEQNLAKLRSIWPEASAGVYSAALGSKQLGCQITFATIGSVYKIAHKMGRIDIVLADECHLINPKSAGIWRSFLADLAKYNPHTRCIGWTGSEFRGNGVFLTAGKDALFTHVATKVTMSELLELGYLAPLVPAETETLVRTDDVRVSGDDYSVADLAAATDKAELVEAACDEIVRLAVDRRRWLVFAVTVEHAGHVRDSLKARGVTAEVVSGDTPAAERAALISAFRAGALRCLVNVGVLTTGFDSPEVDFIALLRATKSPVLYVQIAGRGMRCVGANIEESIRNGKADCLWADFTDTTANMGPVDAIKGRLPRAAPGPAEAPFRLCPECGSRNAASATECLDCGFLFPEPERIKHGDKAHGAAVLSSQIAQDITHQITHVEYHEHRKLGAEHVSLRVEYWAGLLCVAKQWQFPDMKGYRRLEFEAWWRQRGGGRIPLDTREAVERATAGDIKPPPGIVTRRNRKTRHHDIVGFIWRTEE